MRGTERTRKYVFTNTAQ